MERGVVGQEHDTHPAATKPPLDSIRAQHDSGLERVVGIHIGQTVFQAGDAG